MNGTVTRVSPYGFQTQEQGEKWVNKSKFDTDITLDNVKKGSVVSYELNAKGYITKLSVGGSTAVPAPATAQQSAPAQAVSATAENLLKAADLQLGSRALAVKAAFGSPFLAAAGKEGANWADAVEMAEVLSDRLLRYITTGKFDETASYSSEGE